MAEQVFDFEKPIVEIEKMIERLRELARHEGSGFDDQLKELEQKLRERKEAIYTSLDPWQTVQLARHQQRPVLEDYVRLLTTDFIELHGDRRYSDDQAMMGGFATIDGQKIMLVGHSKGKSIEENVRRNFGSARPDGYRKALRLMKIAEKYRLPVVTFIDTSGAYPGRDAEERGQAEAIARNLTEMARLQVPIICLVSGEGGSGGALGIGVGDVVLMLSHAIYSVISPEGCAGILWRDRSFAATAAEALKITAPSLRELGVVDEVIPEPLGGAHQNHEATAQAIREVVVRHLVRLKKITPSKLVQQRFEKYSRIGTFNS